MSILVTGGAGFIGSCFVQDWFAQPAAGPLINLDSLTYAGNPENLAAVQNKSGYTFVEGDIRDRELVLSVLQKHRVRAVVHFAAESHVDRSILGPAPFLDTNVLGTFALLEAVRQYLSEPGATDRDAFRFLHVSTDEVYGSLRLGGAAFTELSRYAPNSPYAASKAASDHLARAWFHTYGVPVIISNCSNNYGPRQFPEKLIPLMVLQALEGKPLPVYGEGRNVRDWLYVGDHVGALRCMLVRGVPGEVYNVGGDAERTNLELVEMLCDVLDEMRPDAGGSYRRLIAFVADRPGHDLRYAMDHSKLTRELGWEPRESLESGLRKTIAWYLDNADWVRGVTSGAYRNWIRANYSAREAATTGATR